MANYPKVVPGDVKGFSKAWDLNGIKMILDSTTLQFAVDFANVVLKSYVDNLIENAQKLKAAKTAAQANGSAQTEAVGVAPVLPSTPQKLITLTDA